MDKPDYKQLCADLVAWAEKTSAHYYSEPRVLIQARAALAEPELQEPTDEELFAVAEAYAEDNGLIGLHNASNFARAVLARWGQPTPQPISVIK